MEIIIEVNSDTLNRLDSTLSSQVLDYFIKSSSEGLSGYIAQNTPVLTGALRSSWTPRLTTQELHITTDKHYAGFVEEGTRFMTGRHMAKKGLEQFEPHIPKLLRLAFAKKGV